MGFHVGAVKCGVDAGRGILPGPSTCITVWFVWVVPPQHLPSHLLLSSQDDDVRKYVNTYRRTFEKNGKKHSKAPKIQR